MAYTLYVIVKPYTSITTMDFMLGSLAVVLGVTAKSGELMHTNGYFILSNVLFFTNIKW
jgi:hypothetical protein